MELDRELETYGRELHRLLAHAGQFVLICGNSVVGVYPEYEDALRAGYKTVGPEPFLVKQIEAEETVYYFARTV